MNKNAAGQHVAYGVWYTTAISGGNEKIHAEESRICSGILVSTRHTGRRISTLMSKHDIEDAGSGLTNQRV